MKFYVSVRPIKFNKILITPKGMFEDGFKGLNVKHKCLGTGKHDDSRWLYEIEVDSVDHQAVVIEALSMFGVHKKENMATLKALADKLSGREYEIDEVTQTIRAKITTEDIETEAAKQRMVSL